ncbi:hypothetical protein CEXT_581051 [Caerostris extrusa]|uniref:Uncharacterized protein n=1 Tax=Caerostris extrusa TaxID=172846 RepID=A0AAV4WZD2_CAEEX|nr:hypothetical protein CEXT_581051 [Caerostris extrusa]
MSDMIKKTLQHPHLLVTPWQPLLEILRTERHLFQPQIQTTLEKNALIRNRMIPKLENPSSMNNLHKTPQRNAAFIPSKCLSSASSV